MPQGVWNVVSQTTVLDCRHLPHPRRAGPADRRDAHQHAFQVGCGGLDKGGAASAEDAASGRGALRFTDLWGSSCRPVADPHLGIVWRAIQAVCLLSAVVRLRCIVCRVVLVSAHGMLQVNLAL